MTAQPASVRLYREHRESARKAADVLRRLNDLFGGNTEWTLAADDLDEIADAYDAVVARRAVDGQAWDRRVARLASGEHVPPGGRP